MTHKKYESIYSQKSFILHFNFLNYRYKMLVVKLSHFFTLNSKNQIMKKICKSSLMILNTKILSNLRLNKLKHNMQLRQSIFMKTKMLYKKFAF